jgi:hypothetical protein
MENNGVSHNTKLWMTIDSPHNGANIPLGTQYALEYLSAFSNAAAVGYQHITRPAAQQMLVYHKIGFDKNPLRQALISDPNFNFPSNIPRTVAISNGSQNSTNQGFNPGDVIMDANKKYKIFNLLSAKVLTAKVRAMPYAGQTISIFEASISIFNFNVSATGNLPIDGAPGGFHPSTYVLATGFDNVTTIKPNHCFIPTTSAIALIGNQDLFVNIASTPVLSPFSKFYVPDNNQRHIAITDQNIAWVLQELGLTPSGIFPVSPTTTVNSKSTFKFLKYSYTVTPTVLRAGEAGINFDGNTGYVNVPTLKTAANVIIPFPDKGAITFWMAPSAIEDYRNPFSTAIDGNGVRFEESTDNGNLGFATVFSDDNAHYQVHNYAGVNVLKTNTWYHVILTWNKSANKVVGYLNGIQIFSESQIYWPSYFPNISIGTCFSFIPKRHFKGLMDDVGIYSQFISTDADILAAMQGPLPTNVTIAYWDFSEGTGTTTADKSGTHPGTLQSGAAWVPTTPTVTYTWSPSFGLNTTSGELVVANPSSSTTYTVIESSTNCSFLSHIEVDVVKSPLRLAVQDEPLISSDVNNISAYPNPASGNITINVSGGSYKVTILDMQGRVLNQYASEEETMNINVSNLTTGLYLFQVIQNGITNMKKLEIQQ